MIEPSTFENMVTIYTLNNKSVYGLSNRASISCIDLFEKLLKILNYRTKYINMDCLYFAESIDGIPYEMDKIIDLSSNPSVYIVHTNIKNGCKYAEELDIQHNKILNRKQDIINKKCMDEIDKIKLGVSRSLNPKFIDKPVIVVSLTGQRKEYIVSANTFVYELKSMIEKNTSIAIELQRLVIKGNLMQNDKELSYYLIDYNDNDNNNNNNIIYLVLRLKGGMFHETSGRYEYDNTLIDYFSLD